jgi:hypothetical protein
VGWFERSAQRQQRIANEQNERYLKDPDGFFDAPGPDWAYGVQAVPILHRLGDIAIALALRERRSRRNQGRS